MAEHVGKPFLYYAVCREADVLIDHREIVRGLERDLDFRMRRAPGADERAQRFAEPELAEAGRPQALQQAPKQHLNGFGLFADRDQGSADVAAAPSRRARSHWRG